MKVYKTYLIKSLAKPFLFSTLVITAIVWLSRFIFYTKYIVEDGISISTFFKLTFFALPSLFLIIMPITTFIATIITYNRLMTNRELFILKNAGIKNISIASPIIILSLIITIFAYLITLYIYPKSNSSMKIIRYEMSSSLSSLAVDKEVFNEFKNVVIYAKDKDKDGNIYGLMIYERGEKGEEKNKLIYSQKARIENNILELQNGNIQIFLKNGDEIPQMIFFDKYNIDLTEYTWQEKGIRFKIQDFYLQRLIEEYNKEPEGTNYKQRVLSEINYRITFPLYSFVLAMIAISVMLNIKLNRTGNSRNITIACIIMVLVFGFSLYLYQLADDSLTAIYFIYFIIISTIIASLIMIKERRMNAKL